MEFLVFITVFVCLYIAVKVFKKPHIETEQEKLETLVKYEFIQRMNKDQ